MTSPTDLQEKIGALKNEIVPKNENICTRVEKSKHCSSRITEGKNRAAVLDIAKVKESKYVFDQENYIGVLDTKAALKRVGGGKELYGKILKTFLRKHSQAYTKVVIYLERGDIESARRISHSLKGVAQIVGSDDLHQIVAEIDTLLANRKVSDLQEKLDSFKEILIALVNSIQIYLSKTDETNSILRRSVTTSRKEALRKIDYLADLLKVRDMEATRAGVECVRHLPDQVPIALIVALQKNLDSLDFNNAELSLQSIKQQIMEAD